MKLIIFISILFLISIYGIASAKITSFSDIVRGAAVKTTDLGFGFRRVDTVEATCYGMYSGGITCDWKLEPDDDEDDSDVARGRTHEPAQKYVKH